MADYTQPPGVNDYKLLLQSIGLYPTDASQQARCDEQLSVIALGVWREFERRTGKKPYLKQGTTATIYFDGTDHTGVLDLGRGLRSVTSLSINGTAQTEGQQFRLEPANAAFDGEPYTSIRLGFNGYASTWGYSDLSQGRIAVTGYWGWYETVEADHWLHILRYGTALALGQVENLQSISSISQDGFNKAFDIVGILTQKDLEQIMQKRFDIVVAQNMPGRVY